MYNVRIPLLVGNAITVRLICCRCRLMDVSYCAFQCYSSPVQLVSQSINQCIVWIITTLPACSRSSSSSRNAINITSWHRPFVMTWQPSLASDVNLSTRVYMYKCRPARSSYHVSMITPVSTVSTRRSRWPDHAADQNCCLRSTKLSCRWSVSIEQVCRRHHWHLEWQFLTLLNTEMYLRSYYASVQPS